MGSQRRREGYLLIDNRCGPGVSAEFVRRSGKKNVPAVGEGQVYESATITCAHCSAVVILNPGRTRERGYCRRCDHYVCDSPECNRECRPFKALLDRQQEAAFLSAQRGDGFLILPSDS